MIRVAIVDDQDVVREGLRAILGTAPDLQVVGVAADGAQAVALVVRHAPDVVLMDLRMPGTNGIHATRTIRERAPRTRVLVLTTYDADEWVLDAIRAGAAGYLLKDSPAEVLLGAIRGTAAGRTHLDPGVAGRVLAWVAASPGATRSPEAYDLSERERSVLRLLAGGLSNAEIAARLSLAEGTVRNYLSVIFEKLDVSDRTQAAIVALRCGLVEDGR